MTESRYSSVAVALHWAIALLILGQILGGQYMHNLPNSSPVKFDLYQLHKSFGLSILALTVFRLAWRFMHPPPALPVAMPGWQKLAARATHWGFYALLLLTPLAGWAIVSVSPTDIPTRWFGVLPVPHLPFFESVTDRGAQEDLFEEIHEILAKGILFLLALHVAAALKHHFVNKDGVLRSMAPARKGQWAAIAAILGLLGVGAGVYFVAPTPVAKAASAPVAQSENAEASNWTVDYEKSSLTFIGQEKENRFEGAFNDFEAIINFDPEDLTASNIKVVVRTVSASTGDSLRDSTIPSREWFHTDAHPTATFTADEIRSIGGNSYEAAGVLRIKDFERPVTVSFELDIDGDNAVATGGADLMRTDFGLGADDSWLDDESVALDVRVEFEIHATRAS